MNSDGAKIFEKNPAASFCAYWGRKDGKNEVSWTSCVLTQVTVCFIMNEQPSINLSYLLTLLHSALMDFMH